MFHFSPVSLRALISASLLCLVATPASAQQDYLECGVIIQGVTCTMLFEDTNGDVWLLEDYGNFQIGDNVFVVGSSDPTCPNICQQGNGCVFSNTIELCGDAGTAYCFCAAGAPCGNTDADAGCTNSTGSGALLTGSGSTSVATDDLSFAGTGLVPGQPALLFVGESEINGGTGVPFGDGLRCAGTNVVRLGVSVPDAGGNAAWGPGLAAQGGWTAGDDRYFQGWYRDSVGPCGLSFNLTQGVQVNFTP